MNAALLKRALFALGLLLPLAIPALGAGILAGTQNSSSSAVGRGPAGGGLYTDGLVPVCNGVTLESNIHNAGNKLMSRTVMWCPSAKNVRFALGGTYQVTTTETDKTFPELVSMSVETNVPALYDPTKTYTTGQQVSWFAVTSGGSSGAPIYQAAQAVSAGQYPTVGNSTNWTPVNNNGLIPVTCGGKPQCTLITTTNAAGAIIAQGMSVPTDPVALNCPSGCFIGLRIFKNTQTGQQGGYASGPGKYLAWNVGIAASAGQTDATASANVGNGVYNVGADDRPVVAIGVPYVGRKTFCILGDSIGWGQLGGSDLNTGISVNSGGSGYTANDMGLEVNVGIAGGSAGAVNSPGRVKLLTQSGGAITAIALSFHGSYTNVTSQPSQTLPSTAQATSGGGTTGSGLTVTVAYTSNGFDTGDSLGAQGFVSRALAESGYAIHNYAMGSDTANNFLARNYSRMNYIRNSGCSDALIEYGINDLSALGRTAAQVDADMTTLAQLLLANGVQRVYRTTISPYVLSTDGFITLGNQSPQNAGINTQRVSYNALVRTGNSSFAGYLEVADCSESARDSGKFKVDGSTVGLYTVDGLHPSLTGEALMASCLLSVMSALASNDNPPAHHYAANEIWFDVPRRAA